MLPVSASRSLVAMYSYTKVFDTHKTFDRCALKVLLVNWKYLSRVARYETLWFW
jgi:hypothetical protein